MSLDVIADELYGLSPAQFTGARNDRAQAARAGGDKALAGQILALRKPTVVAWLANQVVRQHRDMIESLLALGAELRTAMAAPSGPELRRLNARQRDLVNALLQEARELASSSGQPATEQSLQGLSDTLRAALADPGAGQALATGRLAHALTASAFVGVPQAAGSTDAPAPPDGAVQPTDQATDDVAAARRARARQQVAEAQERAEGARGALDEAAAALERAGRRARLAADLADQLRAELAEAIGQRERAELAERAARSAHEQAGRALDVAQERLRVALDALGQPPDAGQRLVPAEVRGLTGRTRGRQGAPVVPGEE